MTPDRSPALGRMFKLLAVGFVVASLIVVLGYVPTKRMGGSGAVAAMLAGCAISFVASIVGSIPIVVASQGPKRQMPTAVMLSTALRFLVVLVLALSAALSGWFERAPLLIWVAISYVLLLAADTVFAVRLAGRAESPEE